TTCAPCRDFDQFANGGWKTRTKLPAGYSNYGAFDELYDRNEAVLRKVLEAAAADRSAPPGTDRARLADYYSSCMDSAGAEAAGGKPIAGRSEEHTSELQSLAYLVCRLLLEKKKKKKITLHPHTKHKLHHTYHCHTHRLLPSLERPIQRIYTLLALTLHRFRSLIQHHQIKLH